MYYDAFATSCNNNDNTGNVCVCDKIHMSYIYENCIAFCSHNHIRAYVSSWHPYYLTLKWLWDPCDVAGQKYPRENRGGSFAIHGFFSESENTSIGLKYIHDFSGGTMAWEIV